MLAATLIIPETSYMKIVGHSHSSYAYCGELNLAIGDKILFHCKIPKNSFTSFSFCYRYITGIDSKFQMYGNDYSAILNLSPFNPVQ